MSDTQIETKTNPWQLEANMVITVADGIVKILVGGIQMPRYEIRGNSIEEAITKLVYAVTEDAIEDEAREWQQATTPHP